MHACANLSLSLSRLILPTPRDTFSDPVPRFLRVPEVPSRSPSNKHASNKHRSWPVAPCDISKTALGVAGKANPVAGCAQARGPRPGSRGRSGARPGDALSPAPRRGCSVTEGARASAREGAASPGARRGESPPPSTAPGGRTRTRERAGGGAGPTDTLGSMLARHLTSPSLRPRMTNFPSRGIVTFLHFESTACPVAASRGGGEPFLARRRFHPTEHKQWPHVLVGQQVQVRETALSTFFWAQDIPPPRGVYGVKFMARSVETWTSDTSGEPQAKESAARPTVSRQGYDCAQARV